MTERDIQGHLLILTDMILKKVGEIDGKDNPPHNAAERAKSAASLKEAEILIQAGITLIGGALIDLNRIANALESLALSHLPQPPR